MDHQLDASALTAIAPGAAFVGSVHLVGPARIDGSIAGDVFADACVWIGPAASVHACVRAREIIVDGRVEGSLHASERVELRATARVNAEIRAPKLVLDEGAIFEGRCLAGSVETGDPGGISTPQSP